MVAGVRRVVCVTVLSSRHWETDARLVSNSHTHLHVLVWYQLSHLVVDCQAQFQHQHATV